MGLDLKEFYFQNITKTEYHHRFYKAIEDINLCIIFSLDRKREKIMCSTFTMRRK